MVFICSHKTVLSFHLTWVGRFALVVRDVMQATMTVGENLFPISF